MKRVLITGAAGTIGRALREHLRGRYALRLSDLAPVADPSPNDEVVVADIRDLAQTEASLAGVDCVVHLAAIAEEAPWDAILSLNIDGTYRVFEAARRQGVKRVVFASSFHAVGFHRRAHAIDTEVPVRPDTRYGVSKVAGEAIGRLYADKYGLEVACLRIGSFRPRPDNVRQLSTTVTPRDISELVRCCIDAPPFHFLIAYGVSGNTRNRWISKSWAFLGFKPQDDAERYAAEIAARNEPEAPLSATFHGGPYVETEFSGNPDKID
jgi:uronate dehydrogenase